MSRVVLVFSGVVVFLQMFGVICCMLEIVKMSFGIHLAFRVTSRSLFGFGLMLVSVPLKLVFEGRLTQPSKV